MTSPVPAAKRPRIGTYRVPRPKYFNVPKNEAEILDLSPGADTPERKLKDLLLSDDEHTKVTAAVGMGGVGKTTDMCAMGYDQDVWIKYRDGIWFIQLGQDITLDDLRVELNVLARKICSAQFAAHFSESLSHRRGLIAALRELVEELAKMDFLLIFDDVWEENEAYDIVKHIANAISACSGRLAMLISTRREEIAHCPLTNAVVGVIPKDTRGILARRILCAHARINPGSLPDPSTSAGKAVDDILRRCAGLPVALAVAGSYMRAAEKDENQGHSWIMLRDSLITNATRFGQKGSNEHKDGLFACIDASMRHVERKWSTGPSGTARELLSSFCIFPKQTWIPLEVLQQTWKTEPGQAELFVEMLFDYNIVSRVVLKGKLGLRAHDLVLDYCMQLAQIDGINTERHKRLVHGYTQRLDRVEGEEVPCLNWWSEKLSADGYIRANAVRHLLGCNMVDEAVRLLCDYRWVEMLNGDETRLPFQQCISDLKRVEQSIATNTDVGNELSRGIGLLVETMEMCLFPTARNRSECPFQLHGRLSSLESAPKVFVRCLWSIEAYATGLWAKAAPGVLGAAGGRLKGIVPVPFFVCKIVVGVGGDEVVLGFVGGEVVLMGLGDGILRWTANADARYVLDLEVDQRTGDVFSANYDGTVAVWREGTRIRHFHPFRQRSEMVTCMKLLIPFNLIACGCHRGKLILIDMTAGRIVRTLNGHADYIISLEAREDGELLISASRDHTVQRWDTKSGKPIGTRLQGHTDMVNCVALSAGGHLIASGSRDKTVRLWDAQEGVEVCAVFSDHVDSVESVLFSHESDVLFSGAWNEILVWNVSSLQNGVSVKHKISHDMRGVTSLCLSNDGEELFAMSKYGRRVFVWRAKAALAVASSCTSDTTFARDVDVFGISQNGKTLVTYSGSSPDMIHIRRVCDVVGGTNNLICSCPVTTTVYEVGWVAVSNDMQYVAYIPFEVYDMTVYVSRASTGEVVHKLTGLTDWINSMDETNSEHVSNLAFDPKNLTIMAEARAERESDGERISKSMRWSARTGQPCPMEPCASISVIEADNTTQDSPQTNSAPHVWVEKVDINSEQFGYEMLASDGSKTLTVGTLDNRPHSVLLYATVLSAHLGFTLPILAHRFGSGFLPRYLDELVHCTASLAVAGLYSVLAICTSVFTIRCLPMLREQYLFSSSYPSDLPI